MPELDPTTSPAPNAPSPNERDCERRRPSQRNRTIYERRVLGGETLAALATEYNLSHQRIAQITTRVEGWIAGHPEDQLANRLRLRCRLRYEALYDSAVSSFADSRKEEVTLKRRTTTRAAKRCSPDVVLCSAEKRPSAERKATDDSPSAERKATDERPSAERKATISDEEQADPKAEMVITIEERIVRQRHGDPRLLATAMKAVEKLERFAAALGDDRCSPKSPTKSDARETADQRMQQRIAAETAWLAARDARVAAEKEDAEKAAAEKAKLGDREKAGIQIQNSGVREETPESTNDDAGVTLATTSAQSPPLPTADCLLPTSPATPHTAPVTPPPTTPVTRPKHVLIVGHYKQIDRMYALAQAKLPGFEIAVADQAGVAKRWIEKHVHEAALIWLENDLGPRREVPGGTINPGTGRDVAVRLVQKRPRCRMLINEGDDHSRPLYNLLDAAGCSVKEVFHEGGDWLRDNWLPALRRALRLPEEDDEFDLGDEDDDFEDEDFGY